MAEFKYKYENLVERKTKVAEAEEQGLRMLHDDFDPDWKHGDEPHGTMTFTDEPSKPAVTEPARDFAAEIDALEARVAEIEKKIK